MNPQARTSMVSFMMVSQRCPPACALQPKRSCHPARDRQRMFVVVERPRVGGVRVRFGGGVVFGVRGVRVGVRGRLGGVIPGFGLCSTLTQRPPTGRWPAPQGSFDGIVTQRPPSGFCPPRQWSVGGVGGLVTQLPPTGGLPLRQRHWVEAPKLTAPGGQLGPCDTHWPLTALGGWPVLSHTQRSPRRCCPA
jgi:hypothetical protein